MVMCLDVRGGGAPVDKAEDGYGAGEMWALGGGRP